MMTRIHIPGHTMNIVHTGLIESAHVLILIGAPAQITTQYTQIQSMKAQDHTYHPPGAHLTGVDALRFRLNGIMIETTRNRTVCTLEVDTRSRTLMDRLIIIIKMTVTQTICMLRTMGIAQSQWHTQGGRGVPSQGDISTRGRIRTFRIFETFSKMFSDTSRSFLLPLISAILSVMEERRQCAWVRFYIASFCYHLSPILSRLALTMSDRRMN